MRRRPIGFLRGRAQVEVRVHGHCKVSITRRLAAFAAVFLLAAAYQADVAAAPDEHLGAEYGEYRHGNERQIFGAAKDQQAMSLAGPWQCRLDPEGKGLRECWFDRRFDQPIRLPGTLDEAGYGEKNTQRTPRWLNRRFVYVGSAWYQRNVEIPEAWRGKRVTLLLERVMWESRVWVDGRPAGANDSLSTPHVYDLTPLLAPGRHLLTVRVDNSGRPGANCHGYGDDEQIRWNGLLGRLELQAQDPVHIRGVQVYPDVAGRRAIVRVDVGNIAYESFDGTITVTARPTRAHGTGPTPPGRANFKISGPNLPIEVILPLGDSFARWDEFSPALYEATVNLAAEAGGKRCCDRATVTFGMRELSHHGTQLVLNGRTLLLRGTHDGGGFPLTGHPAMDVAAWRKIFQTCKAYGLNHVRYHSFCPPEAAFVAADEEGILLLAELPVWGQIGPDWAGTPFLRAELQRILDAYGNHPSFGMMSMGNEHSGDWDVLARFVDEGRRRDPRHLYAAASNQYIRMGKDPQPINSGDQFAVIMKGPKAQTGFESGRIRYMERLIHGEPPAFAADYREILQGFEVPTFAHELGQWWTFPDVREAVKYSGVLRSGAMDLFRESLDRAGLMLRMERFHRASAALAVRLYKEDIERQLRTPGLGGFQLLDLHDYTGQNTSLVGLLDAFWDSKGAISPEKFRRFCGPTVPLARWTKVIWSNTETLRAEIEVAHYGPADLTNVTPAWRLVDDRGGLVAEGSLPRQERISTGQSTHLGVVRVDLSRVTQARALTLEVTVGQAANDWNLWVYPASSAPAPDAGNVRITENLDADALRFLEGGGRVLLLGHNSPHTVPTDFPNPVWNPWIGGGLTSCGLLITAGHPALAEFPTQTHSDWQWRDLLEPEARAFVLNDLPPDADLIAETIDEPLRAFRLGVLWEAGVGRGTLLATSMNLDQQPAARQLRRSLLAYLASDRCQPALRLSAEQARRVVQGDRFRFVNAVPAGDRVMLEVEPSVQAPADTASPWRPEHDHVVRREPGFDYEFRTSLWDPWKSMPSVSWNKRGQGAWMAGRFTVHLKCPPEFSGTMYVQFHDVDSGKAEAAIQSGRDAWFVGPHGGAGKWVALRIQPEDLSHGELEVTAFKPAGGDTWSRAPRITRLVIAAPKAPLIRDFQPLSVRGVNYYPRETPWGGMWTRTPPEVWQRDMAVAASLGVNTIRTFVPFNDGLQQAGLVEADGTPTPAYLEKLDTLLAAAWRHNIRGILCFEFSQPWLTASGASARWKRAVSTIVDKHRDDGRVLLWDLMNEPEDDAKWTDATRAYLHDALPRVRQHDPNHLTTVGLTWRIDRLVTVGLPDVLQYHEYCPKGPLFEKGPSRVSQTVAGQRKAGSHRPLLIGEFGMSTARDPDHGAEESRRAKIGDAPGTEAEQARLYEIVLTAAEKDEVAGVLPWCLYDYAIENPNESHFGLIRGDGSLKPAAEVLHKAFFRWSRR